MVSASIRNILLLASSALFISVASAQNCGPAYGGARCANAGDCCSQYGWCGTTDAHCDIANCFPGSSGANSRCRPTTTATSSPTSWPSYIPEIDVCGPQAGVGCPGVGSNGYYYRCCSPRGHCGPKNPIQSANDYCGTGCQPGFGDCTPTRPVPPAPPAPPVMNTFPNGECGPIINRRCRPEECCSGSNFCGVGPDYCGAANWCQVNYGGFCRG